MGRRTKEELLSANYYDWLAASNVLREKKKSGAKLSADEKMLLRTVPSPESPYRPAGQPAIADKPKKKLIMKKITFDKSVRWGEKGNAFLCAVFNTPYEDSQCMLFCERDDCPFHGVGYFRSHGVKF
jgi:hypothetical protein